jgi:hypothetical protein
MAVRKLTLGLAVTAACALSAAPAGAHGDHGSCALFGALVSDAAQFAPPFGAVVSANARAGAIPEVISGYHASFCSAREP